MNVTTDNDGGTARGKNGNRMLPGLLLIGLGLLVLFTNLGLSIVGNLLTAGIFAGLAYFVYQNGVRTGREGMKLLAIPLAGLALVTLLPGRASGALFLAFIGLAFAVVWRTDQKRWWAVIPAGAFASLAATAGLSGISGNLGGFVFLGGLAATFYALTRLRVEPQAWAIYPAGALGAVAALALFGGGGSWLFPIILLVAGVVLLARSGAVEIPGLTDLLQRTKSAPRPAEPTTPGAEIVPAAADVPVQTSAADVTAGGDAASGQMVQAETLDGAAAPHLPGSGEGVEGDERPENGVNNDLPA